MKYQIVYLSHGGHKFHIQTRFSVLSLLHHLLQGDTRDIGIVIYTDAPADMPVHRLVQKVELSVQQLRAWRGPLDYVHRVKLQVLKYHHQMSDLPTIFVDCDTQWIRPPDRELTLLAGNAPGYSGRPIGFMHENEGPLSSTYHSAYLKLLDENAPLLSEFGLQVPEKVMMWNAGVIGVPDAVGFFDDAIALTDEFLISCPVKNWIEQLTVSLIAQQRCNLNRLNHCVRHYWRSSFALPLVLGNFFKPLGVGFSLEAAAQECANFPLQTALDKYELTLGDMARRWLYRQKCSLAKRKMAARSHFHKTKHNVRAS